MELEKVIKERYSVRKYQNKLIEEEKLTKILEAGRLAPTAKNSQPQRIYVIREEQNRQKLKELTPMTYDAPVILMICIDLNEVCRMKIEENYHTGEMDASIVTTHMMLEAWNLGLGSVWVRYFNSDELQKAFALPDNIKPICLLPIGYPALDSTPNEKLHFARKDLTAEVTYL